MKKEGKFKVKSNEKRVKSLSVKKSAQKENQETQYRIKKAFDIGNPHKIKHIFHKIKDQRLQEKTQKIQDLQVPLTLNFETTTDCEQLEIELKKYEQLLEKENDNHNQLKDKFNVIMEEINGYEKIIEENKFLFQQSNNVNQKKHALQKDEGLDEHTQSLLKMMQHKHKNLEQKLQERQKEFDDLKKGFKFTELIELLSDIEQIKLEIERIDGESKNLMQNLDIDNKKIINSFSEKKQTKKKVNFTTDKKITENNDQNEYFKTVSQFFNGNQNVDVKDDFKQLLLNNNQRVKDLEILLTNHLILENLMDENNKLTKELTYLQDENLILEKTNSSIQETIKQQKNTLQKLKDEYKAKKECCETLMKEENKLMFEQHEQELKKKFKKKEEELKNIKMKLKQKEQEIKQKEKELKKVYSLYHDTLSKQQREEKLFRNKQNLRNKVIKNKEGLGKSLHNLANKYSKLNKEIKEINVNMLKFKLHIESSNISYDKLFKALNLNEINDLTDEGNLKRFIKMFHSPPINFHEDETIEEIFVILKDQFELLEFEFTIQELFFFLLGDFPIFENQQLQQESLKSIKLNFQYDNEFKENLEKMNEIITYQELVDLLKSLIIQFDQKQIFTFFLLIYQKVGKIENIAKKDIELIFKQLII